MLNSHENDAMRRFERLERANRLYRRIIVLGLVGGALLLTGWNNVDERHGPLAAEAFHLMSAEGKKHASFHLEPGGGSALEFYDAQEKSVSRFGVSKEGEAYLTLCDKARQPRVELRVSADGQPSLRFHGKDGKRRGWIEEDKDGQIALGFSDQAGTHRIGFSVQANGAPAVSFYDHDGKPRGVIQLTPDGAMQLKFSDQAQRDRVRLEVQPDGTPGFELLDQNGASLFKAPQP